jgi:hypothetical protein
MRSNVDQGDLFDFEKERIRGMVRRPSLVTSVFAASAVELIRSGLQKRIILALYELGAMTDDELEGLAQFSHYAYSTVSKRRTELYQKGIVVIVSEKLNAHGCRMKVWDLHEDVRRKMDQERQ